MSIWKKIYLWILLPVVLVISIVECFWVEIHRLFTDSLFVKKFRENYSDIKQLYTDDIFK